MRKVEKEMVAAVNARRSWQGGNTTVSHDRDGVSVSLHGHVIYRSRDAEGYNVAEATFAGWPTSTTRSRLRALGVQARTQGPRHGDKIGYVIDRNGIERDATNGWVRVK